MSSLEEGMDLATLCEELRPLLAKWVDLGVQMKIPSYELDAIKVQYMNSEGTQGCLREVLKLWLKGRALIAPTWLNLLATLNTKVIGENILAAELEEKHQQSLKKLQIGPNGGLIEEFCKAEGIPLHKLDEKCDDMQVLVEMKSFFDWQATCPLLNIDVSDIVQEEGREDQKCWKALERWRETSGDGATYRSLMEAMLKAGRTDQTLQVCKAISRAVNTNDSELEGKLWKFRHFFKGASSLLYTTEGSEQESEKSSRKPPDGASNPCSDHAGTVGGRRVFTKRRNERGKSFLKHFAPFGLAGFVVLIDLIIFQVVASNRTSYDLSTLNAPESSTAQFLSSGIIPHIHVHALPVMEVKEGYSVYSVLDVTDKLIFTEGKRMTVSAVQKQRRIFSKFLMPGFELTYKFTVNDDQSRNTTDCDTVFTVRKLTEWRSSSSVSTTIATACLPNGNTTYKFPVSQAFIYRAELQSTLQGSVVVDYQLNGKHFPGEDLQPLTAMEPSIACVFFAIDTQKYNGSLPKVEVASVLHHGL